MLVLILGTLLLVATTPIFGIMIGFDAGERDADQAMADADRQRAQEIATTLILSRRARHRRVVRPFTIINTTGAYDQRG